MGGLLLCSGPCDKPATRGAWKRRSVCSKSTSVALVCAWIQVNKVCVSEQGVSVYVCLRVYVRWLLSAARGQTVSWSQARGRLRGCGRARPVACGRGRGPSSVSVEEQSVPCSQSVCLDTPQRLTTHACPRRETRRSQTSEPPPSSCSCAPRNSQRAFRILPTCLQRLARPSSGLQIARTVPYVCLSVSCDAEPTRELLEGQERGSR